MKIILSLLITLTSLQVQARTQGKMSETTKKMIQELLHAHKGCPENSSCTKEQGSLYLKFSNSLSGSQKNIRDFNRESGFPLRLFTTQKDSTEEITYDSKCFSHRSGEKKYYQVIKFILNTKEVNNKGRFFPRVFLSKKNKFITSTNASPLYTTNNSLYSFLDFNNKIYTLKSSKSGALEFDFNNNSPTSPKSVKCSKELKDIFSKYMKDYPNFQNLFKGSYCQDIFNIETKSYETYITGWDC